MQIIETASPEVIRGAYRHLCQKWHPDKNPNKREEAAQIMRMVNEAYAVLSDPVQRRKHDAWIKEQKAQQEDTANSQSESTAKEQAESSDVDFYGIVGDELLNGVVEKGLWVKALVDANGDENQQKVLYIKYRVNQLKEELKQRKEQSRHWKREGLRRQEELQKELDELNQRGKKRK